MCMPCTSNGQRQGRAITDVCHPVQANAVSDKLLDLRKCKLQGANLSGKTLSGGIFVDADLSGSNLREAVFSKAYAIKSNFKGECVPLHSCIAGVPEQSCVQRVVTALARQEANIGHLDPRPGEP